MHAIDTTPSVTAVLAALSIILVFCGVVLPGVWSRRQAAAKILAEILSVFRRQPRR